jgi:hypothetical protein
MNVALPTGTTGRALALALLTLLAMLAWFAAVDPLLEWHARRAEALAHKQTLLPRLEALAASLPEWRRAQAESASRAGARPSLLEGGTDAVAAAALQGRVQAMASQAGARVTSMEILAAEARGPYRRIAVRVAAEGQLPELLELLRAVGDAAPRMLVDAVQLNGPNAQATTDTPPIAASFTVLAFRAGTGAGQP